NPSSDSTASTAARHFSSRELAVDLSTMVLMAVPAWERGHGNTPNRRVQHLAERDGLAAPLRHRGWQTGGIPTHTLHLVGPCRGACLSAGRARSGRRLGGTG